jgi:hypothetical protein
MSDSKYSAPPFSLDGWKAEAEKQLKGNRLNLSIGIHLKESS